MEKFDRNIFRREAIDSYVSGKVRTEKIDIKKPPYAGFLWLAVVVFAAAAFIFWNSAVKISLTGIVRNAEAFDSEKKSRILRVAIPTGYYPLVKAKKSVLVIFGETQKPVKCDYLLNQEDGGKTSQKFAGDDGGIGAPKNAEISLSCPDRDDNIPNDFSDAKNHEFRMEIENVKVVSLFF